MVPSSFKIPLNSFGPYTPNTATKGCAAAAPDKWAFGTCTLLKAAGPNKLASAAEGAIEENADGKGAKDVCGGKGVDEADKTCC